MLNKLTHKSLNQVEMNPRKSSFTSRLTLVRNHLSFSQKGVLDKYRLLATFDKKELFNLYYPAHQEIREMVFKIINEHPEIFKHYTMFDTSRPEARKLLLDQVQTLVKETEKIMPFKDIREDLPKFLVYLDACNSFEQSIVVFFAFHSVLYYTSLRNLSTVKHQKYIDENLAFKEIGCFGLTEFGHGSNVKDIQTVATYDIDSKEFILNTNDISAYKWWIGGAGKHATMAIIFAQLYIKDKCYGVHCFLVRLRDLRTHMIMPGVIIGDCGPKLGFEAIDNGFIGFRNHRINKDALLDRFSQVSDSGEFTSTFKSSDERFAAVLGALEEGRVSLVGGAQNCLRNGLAIAGRYAVRRRQFGKEDGKEESVFDYQTTQVRLVLPLVEHFAFRFSTYDLAVRWQDILNLLHDPKNISVVEAHALISAMKPISTAQVQKRLQALREQMGGHGYSSFSLIGNLRNVNDINCTWEGDNTVLVQQCAKFILTNFQRKLKGKPVEFETLEFLNKLGEDTQKPNFSEPKLLHSYETLLKMFEHRALLLVQKSVERLAVRVEEKDHVFDAWNNSQIFYIQHLVKAYGEVYVLKCFKRINDTIVDESTRIMLNSFLTLYALSSIESDIGLFRENDYIQSEHYDLIKNEILSLCKALSKEFIGIMDVITPPDFILGSPLGASDDDNYDKYIGHVFGSKGCFERPDYWATINKK